MSDFTFLDKEYLQKEKNIFEKIERQAQLTDFAIVLGAQIKEFSRTDGNIDFSQKTMGSYWIKTDDGEGDAFTINARGDIDIVLVDDRSIGARPVFPFKLIALIPTNGNPSKKSEKGIFEEEYGYYPQTAASAILQDDLEKLYKSGNIIKTGNVYTTDAFSLNQRGRSFLPKPYEEYEYNGSRYIRVGIINSYYEEFFLSNGRRYHNARGESVWIEVEPVKWLVDLDNQILMSDKILFAGVQFNRESNYFGKFESTDIKSFMDTYFANELIQKSRGLSQNMGQYSVPELKHKEVKESSEKQIDMEAPRVKRVKNPYNFNFHSVSEEDIIKGAVQSGVAVFLHGRSSEGKSARVKQVDPDCEIIYLRNATPESLNGKSVYNQATGEMIDVKPTWLQKLETKCEEEKDKIHVVFFDEMTNALHSIQGMAFNIVLDREVNGKWKLPENARIVAAGNDMDDSLAANELAEPLFNRFAHVYIETTVDSWLKWAASPKESYKRLDYEDNEPEMKIHPSIYAYIAHKGERVLRTTYNGKTPNADPRKWEMASKVLYATKQPEMLRALIGEDLTRDFTEFCKQQVISINDVINGNYDSDDFNMNISEKYLTAVGLSMVDEDNLEKVRGFVSNLGGEILATFDNLWARGDNERLEKIAELRAEKDLVDSQRLEEAEYFER